MHMFYIKVDNEETGPITAKQLKHKAKSGKINKSVLVRKENSDKWYPSNKVKGLFPDNSSQDLSDFIFLGITSEEVFDVNNPVICTDVRQKSKEIKKPKEKDQLIAVLLSFVIPGMGQIYKGEIIQGGNDTRNYMVNFNNM